MRIVRVLTPITRAAVAGGVFVIAALAAGAYVAFDQLHATHEASAFERLQGQGQRLVVSEFGEDADTVVAVDPNDVTQRTIIATIDHATGYGVFPVLSPDGKAIAYTGLPASEKRPSASASARAAVVDIDANETVLSDDVDLLVPPVWSPDSKSIVVRKNTPGDNGDAGTFDLILLGRDGSRSTITTWHTASTFPIAFSPDGSLLYFATLNSNGTDLYSVAPDGSGETKVAHLSDQIARDWKLSPDGAKLAFSVAQDSGAPATKTLDIAGASIADAIAPDASLDDAIHGELSPAWKGGGLTVASLKPYGGGDAVAVDPAGGASKLTDNDDSVDLPESWSPDGSQLVVRAIKGTSPDDVQESHVEIVDGNGGRARVSDIADVLIVGWVQ